MGTHTAINRFIIPSAVYSLVLQELQTKAQFYRKAKQG